MGKQSPRCSTCNAVARVRGPKALRAGGVCKRCYDKRAKAKAAEAKAAEAKAAEAKATEAKAAKAKVADAKATEAMAAEATAVSYAYAHNSVRPVTCAITLALGTSKARCDACEQAAHNYKRTLKKWKARSLSSATASNMMGDVDPIARRQVCITEQVKYVLNALQAAPPALNSLEGNRRRITLLQELKMLAMEVDVNMIPFDDGGIAHKGKIYFACPGLVMTDVGLDDVQRFLHLSKSDKALRDSNNTAMCESCADLKAYLKALVLSRAATREQRTHASSTTQWCNLSPGSAAERINNVRAQAMGVALDGATGLGSAKRTFDATEKPKEPKPKRVKKLEVRRELDLPVAA
ncbi:hypothetical protein SPRG_14874 [Saprolegnia parasitica CBS 223.65]|uniref:Uncharacterized protein n=1 Tax=Saprolegnia parasitica (strain CBS 223.65) TaxID=695850 RepID=A0A067BLJ5_SAPPC|nr:hypothetical protein SPRG_14874 [Saprolegnia parasitica CBS 223.65]KDO19354.1 hypothetical protein SPRG_14874 [Saprolegnia parasitica CBS 223.65]|eukprot:XP_012209942.1 hypothetical protein SPRG_14874 [Saprolegnia parasitica CBS 223.65]